MKRARWLSGTVVVFAFAACWAPDGPDQSHVPPAHAVVEHHGEPLHPRKEQLQGTEVDVGMVIPRDVGSPRVLALSASENLEIG